MEKITIALAWALSHWEFMAPAVYFLLDLIGRWIPTIKRGSLWSTLGKILDAVSSFWFLLPIAKILHILRDICWKISDKMEAVVPDKRK